MARNDILPKIGKIKVADLNRRDVEELHQSLKESPYQANRVRALLSKMLNLAKHWEWRATIRAREFRNIARRSATAGFRPKKSSVSATRLNKHPNQSAANAIRLMLLTGARKGEALTATWAEFNLELGVWTKPSHHTKQKRTEHVPLSAPAVQLLVSMKEKSDSAYLFPGEVDGKPIQEIKRVWMALCKQAQSEKRAASRSPAYIRKSLGLVRNVAPHRRTPARAHSAADHGALCASSRRSAASGNESFRFNCGCRSIPQARRRRSAASRPEHVTARPRASVVVV